MSGSVELFQQKTWLFSWCQSLATIQCSPSTACTLSRRLIFPRLRSRLPWLHCDGSLVTTSLHCKDDGICGGEPLQWDLKVRADSPPVLFSCPRKSDTRFGRSDGV